MITFKQYLTENDFITKAGKTARPWKTTQVYRTALKEVIKKGDKVLDYGSGPYQKVKPHVLALGAKYYPYDSYNNIGKLTTNNDVVMGSNVLNVAVYADNPVVAYNNALNEMTNALNSSGTLVVNMPTSGPRADWMNAKQLGVDLMKRFNEIKKVTGETFIARYPK